MVYYYGDDFSVGMNLLGGEGVMNFGYDLLFCVFQMFGLNC